MLSCGRAADQERRPGRPLPRFPGSCGGHRYDRRTARLLLDRLRADAVRRHRRLPRSSPSGSRLIGDDPGIRVHRRRRSDRHRCPGRRQRLGRDRPDHRLSSDAVRHPSRPRDAGEAGLGSGRAAGDRGSGARRALRDPSEQRARRVSTARGRSGPLRWRTPTRSTRSWCTSGSHGPRVAGSRPFSPCSMRLRCSSRWTRRHRAVRHGCGSGGEAPVSPTCATCWGSRTPTPVRSRSRPGWSWTRRLPSCAVRGAPSARSTIAIVREWQRARRQLRAGPCQVADAIMAPGDPWTSAD